MGQLGMAGRAGLALPESAGSPLHDALNAVATAPASTGHSSGPSDLWPLLGRARRGKHAPQLYKSEGHRHDLL